MKVARIVFTVVFAVTMHFLSSELHANVELSIEQAQAHSNGGCFYLVATPTEGETMQNYTIVPNVSGMTITNFSSAWEYNGITGNATGFGSPTAYAQLGTNPFSISDSFVVAQFEYVTSTPESVSFGLIGASVGDRGTTFDTSAGNYVTDNSFPISASGVPKLILPPVANNSGALAHDPGSTYTLGTCQDFVPVPEPSSFLFLSLVMSGWMWKRRRQFNQTQH